MSLEVRLLRNRFTFDSLPSAVAFVNVVCGLDTSIRLEKNQFLRFLLEKFNRRHIDRPSGTNS